MRKGSLDVVGTGIQCPAHLTLEAKSVIEHADCVLYLVTEPVAAKYICSLNETTEDLYKYYELGKPRIQTYNMMVDRILEEVRNDRKVCAAFYGHPGVFVYPSHTAIRLARQEGYSASMLAAPSAEDCLFSDLGIDPGMGCQSYEATGFLLGGVTVNISAILVLWQIGALGDQAFNPVNDRLPKRLRVLSEYLQRYYPGDHVVYIYEAAAYPICKPRIEPVALHSLGGVSVSGISTLCVPPAEPLSKDEAMIELLGMNREHLKVTEDDAIGATRR